MLRDYRKRFVKYNMLLVGVVLLIAVIAQDVYLYRASVSELRNTMRMVTVPWGMMEETLFDRDQRPPVRPEGVTPDEGASDHPRLDERTGAVSDRAAIGDIVTVFYNEGDGSLSILPDSAGSEEDTLRSAVSTVLEEEQDFGRLTSYGLLYYREEGPRGWKIAFADSSYLNSRLLRNSLMLLAVYAVSMGLVYLISVRLSKLAAKPMEEAIELERQFVADISHDLKTPITVVLANNSILRDDPDMSADERTQWIDSTEDAAKNMMDMVGQMLTLSSLESVGRTVEKQPVNLSSAAEKADLQLESLAFERGVEVEADIEENVIIRGSRDYVERLCSDLLENALKYEPSGGRILFTLNTERRRAVLRVQNLGSFISEEDLPHIFERFYRGDKARDTSKGHGLGLSIIKQITQLMDGEIDVEISRSEGTVFTVSFELAEP